MAAVNSTTAGALRLLGAMPSARGASASESRPLESAAALSPTGTDRRASNARGRGGKSPVDLADPHTSTAVAILLAGVLDPMAMLTGLEGRLRDVGSNQQERDVRVETQRSETADAARKVSLDKARALAEKAAAKAPPWVKKLLGAVITAIGAAASVFTGGASLALSVIGVVLMVAGEVVQALANHGVIDEKNGGIAAAAIKLVAAAIMTVASFGANSGALAQAAGTVVKVAVDVAKYAAQTAQTIQAARDIQRTKLGFESTMHRLDADEQQAIVEGADQSVEDAAAAMVGDPPALFARHEASSADARSARRDGRGRHEADGMNRQTTNHPDAPMKENAQ